MGVIATRRLYPRELAEFSFLCLRAGLHQEDPFANNSIRIITTMSLFLWQLSLQRSKCVRDILSESLF